MPCYRIIEDECNPKDNDNGSESPEEGEDFKLKIPDPEEISDDDMPSENSPEDDSDMYNKFMVNDTRPSEEDTLFVDIEEEEEERKERLKGDEKMLQSPDESFDLSSVGDEAAIEATFTQEPLEKVSEEMEADEVAPKEEVEEKKFCCKKHNKVFSQSQTSIRMCASRQLYEQVVNTPSVGGVFTFTIGIN